MLILVGLGRGFLLNKPEGSSLLAVGHFYLVLYEPSGETEAQEDFNYLSHNN